MTLALVGGTVALVIVVIGASLLDFGTNTGAVAGRTGGAGSSDELRGADVPPPGVLPGRLWVVASLGEIRQSCVIRSVDFDELSLGPPGELRHCALVDVSIDGRYGVAFDNDLNLGLFDLTRRPEHVRDLGRIVWDTSARTLKVGSIAGDGSRVAWCSSPNETTVQNIESGAEQRLPGCDPRFSPAGQAITRTVPPLPDAILVEGEPLLDSSDFREGLGLGAEERAALMAYDVAENGSVATKVRRVIGLPKPTVQIWSGVELAGQYPVIGLERSLGPSGIELSPDAARVAFGWPELLAGIFDTGFEQMDLGLDHGPYAWSPDGRWLAVGQISSIAVYAAGSQSPTYVLPLSPLTLRWTQ